MVTLNDDRKTLFNEAIFLESQVEKLSKENSALKEQLDWFHRQLFGKKSEKICNDVNALQIEFEGFVSNQPVAEQKKKTKIKKHGKIIEVYDPKRHIWSNGLAGLIIKEECKNANLRDWEIANVRSYVIQELLEKPEN